MNKAKRYGKKKAPPPYSNARAGNRHKLPSPARTSHSRAASILCGLQPNTPTPAPFFLFRVGFSAETLVSVYEPFSATITWYLPVADCRERKNFGFSMALDFWWKFDAHSDESSFLSKLSLYGSMGETLMSSNSHAQMFHQMFVEAFTRTFGRAFD